MIISMSHLTEEGRLLLRAARVKSATEAYIPNRDGRVWAEPEAIKIDLIDLIDGEIDTWNIPEKVLELEAGPNAIWNAAAREFRQARRGKAIRGLQLTPKEWLDTYGLRFGISSLEYVRQMCREQMISLNRARQKPFRAKLPAPFHAIKAGSSWMITA